MHPATARACQSKKVGQVVPHLVDELHLLIQEVVLQEVTELGVSASRTQGMKIHKGLVQALLRAKVASMVYLTPLEMALAAVPIL